ncbi:MAG: hypothetical protein ACRCZF_18880 [Gemmataceae bacterium]
MDEPQPKKRRRWLRGVVLVLVGGTAVGYVGSYLHLARRGQAEAAAVGFPTFFYVPLTDLDSSGVGLERHHRRAAWYAPLSALDRAWGGAAIPPTGRVRGVTLGLGTPPE